ncbi:MAG: hypothetical protein ACXU89_09400 [Xanthobacteraceae bacterium]
MNSHNAVSATPQYRSERPKRITEHELFAAKVKLIGLMLLGLVCTVVLMVAPP